MTGQGEFGFFGVQRGHIDRIYLGNAASIADITPPKFRAIETPTPMANVPTIVRFAVIDSHTSETGEHVKSVMLSYTVGTSDEQTIPATFVGGDLFRAVIPAQAAGAELSFVVSAADPVGESASSEPVLLTIAAPPGGEGGAAGSPAGGADDGPSNAGSSGAAVGGTSPTGGAPTPAGGEAAGGEQGTPPREGDDDGCGCSVPGAAPAPYGALAGLLLAATLLFRRRRAW